jgi:hypothetical protein
MIFRTTVLVLLATFASKANACPLTAPEVDIDGFGGTCEFMSQSCFYDLTTGAPACVVGTQYQCRCASGSDPFKCSCRGDGKEGDDTDIDALEVELSGASTATVASTLMASGAIAAVFMGL